MLSKPQYGWTEFKLDGTKKYNLSYLDDIAFEWLDQSIWGLENMSPFCVKGFLEPNRFLCVVSYWNCYLITENEGKEPLGKMDVQNEYSHTSMIEFCKDLHQDISSHIDEWVSFADYNEDSNLSESRRFLCQKLDKLANLIAENSKYFDKKCAFL